MKSKIGPAIFIWNLESDFPSRKYDALNTKLKLIVHFKKTANAIKREFRDRQLSSFVTKKKKSKILM